ncbi:hypothetical protein [Sorangium sp. So ce1097]|uniref:hypothetical protein n=1 Tax=Sorangium sp. So ce1097 TaxID=3133330 RepID=UPI003F605C57
MGKISRVESLGTERVGKLLLEMSSQTTFSLVVYAIYSLTDIYFLSVGVNSLAAAAASILSPVQIALGAVATGAALALQAGSPLFVAMARAVAQRAPGRHAARARRPRGAATPPAGRPGDPPRCRARPAMRDDRVPR